MDRLGRIYPGERKSTYAQTIDRSMYSVVGLGRPPFPYNRKTGFLSYSKPLFNEKEGATDGGETVFRQCRTIEQCFVDEFTYNGVRRDRMIYDDKSRSTPVFREWGANESEVCGIFGYRLEKDAAQVECPGLDTRDYACCKVLTLYISAFCYLFFANHCFA
jgi:hypothetical protein